MPDLRLLVSESQHGLARLDVNTTSHDEPMRVIHR